MQLEGEVPDILKGIKIRVVPETKVSAREHLELLALYEVEKEEELQEAALRRLSGY